MALLSAHRNSDARRVFENRSGRERKMAGEAGQHLWHQLATARVANRERFVTRSTLEATTFCLPGRTRWHEVGEGGGERKPAGESTRQSPRNVSRASRATAWIGTPGGIRTHDLLLRSLERRGSASGRGLVRADGGGDSDRSCQTWRAREEMTTREGRKLTAPKWHTTVCAPLRRPGCYSRTRRT